MTYSIVIRVPWKRQNEEIIWDENKDNMLWKFISLHSQPNEIDWNSISSRLNINESECKQRASHLYKQQFIKLQNETLLNISASNSNNNSTTTTTTTSSDNNNSNTFSQQINRQQQQQHTQQKSSPIPPRNNNVEDIQRLVISVQRNSFDWVKVSKEIGLPPLECRNLFLSYQQQQKSPVNNNNYNNISNSSAFLNSNNNNNNIQRVQQQQRQQNFLRRSSNDNPITSTLTIEGSITQSELIDALIDEEDRQKLQQRR